jgi:hypothetical protein
MKKLCPASHVKNSPNGLSGVSEKKVTSGIPCEEKSKRDVSVMKSS